MNASSRNGEGGSLPEPERVATYVRDGTLEQAEISSLSESQRIEEVLKLLISSQSRRSSLSVSLSFVRKRALVLQNQVLRNLGVYPVPSSWLHLFDVREQSQMKGKGTSLIGLAP